MFNKKYQNHVIFGKKRLLTLCSSSFAVLGLLMLFISLTTDYWITTFERMTNFNITNIISQNSGLWRKCWQSYQVFGVTKTTIWSDSMKILPSGLTKNCSFISYFKGKPKNAGEMKAPEAILYEMRTSAIFSVISLVVLLTGSVLSMLSFCDEKLKKSTFVASGLYVLSGIFLLIGIVLYVGCISQAFDSKSDNTDSENVYLYEYGISFYFSVAAFIFSEFAGVFCIYLYIAKQKQLHKIINNSEFFIKPELDDKIIKSHIFNHTEFQTHNNEINNNSNININPSEISPLSNNSQPSYHAYRRYSEQLLLKLYPTVNNGSQYSSPSRTLRTYSKTLNDNRVRREEISFIPEFRASKASPIINYLCKRESNENLYDSSPMVIFYNDKRVDSGVKHDENVNDSLILNETTYYDSPISESLSEKFKPSCSSNVCNTCNLSFNLCNCACALLFLDKSNINEQKIYSNINSSFPLSNAIYNGSNNNNNNNNNINNNTSAVNASVTNTPSCTSNANNVFHKSTELENLIQINSSTFSKIGKPRKITAV